MNSQNRLTISNNYASFQYVADNPSYSFGQIKYNLKDAVKVPLRENPNEWIAYNIFVFHRQISMLYGTINEYCGPNTCPKMSAGKNHVYLWSYDPRYEPVECCAKEYIKRLLHWVREQLEDEEIFPSLSIDKDFPSNFMETCKSIAKRLFRVYANIYHHHLHEVRILKEKPHMNSGLKHFIYFIQEFDLVPQNELDPLKDFFQILSTGAKSS